MAERAATRGNRAKIWLPDRRFWILASEKKPERRVNTIGLERVVGGKTRNPPKERDN